MKLFSIQKNVMSGQCKGALLRLQIGHTAIFFFPEVMRGWVGSQIGLFTPKKNKQGEYRLHGFYFRPWLAKDVSINQLPTWYRRLTHTLSFNFD